MATTRATRSRLDPEVFDLPVEKMRAGYYTDAYFNHSRAALLRTVAIPRVVMQVFQKNDAYLGGIDEAIAILKLCSDDWEALDRPRALRRRPDRAVRDGADDRGRLHAVRAPRDRSISACSRGAR